MTFNPPVQFIDKKTLRQFRSDLLAEGYSPNTVITQRVWIGTILRDVCYELDLIDAVPRAGGNRIARDACGNEKVACDHYVNLSTTARRNIGRRFLLAQTQARFPMLAMLVACDRAIDGHPGSLTSAIAGKLLFPRVAFQVGRRLSTNGGGLQMVHSPPADTKLKKGDIDHETATIRTDIQPLFL